MLSFIFAIILIHGCLFQDALYFRSMVFGGVSGLSIVSRCWDRGPRIAHSDEKQRSGDLLVGCWLACRYEEVRDSGTKWHIRSKGGRPLQFPLSLNLSFQIHPVSRQRFSEETVQIIVLYSGLFSSSPVQWKFHLFNIPTDLFV